MILPKDWGEVLVAGFVGSLVGGLLGNLLSGNGLSLHFSGLIGSCVDMTGLTIFISARMQHDLVKPNNHSGSNNEAGYG